MNAPRQALFLDRDGVINVNHGYVCTPERTDFIDGIFALCKQATVRGFLNVVVTNQAGIARGFYTEAQFHAYMDWMRQVFVDHGAHLDAVYFCPHHAEAGIGEYRRACDCRKPAPGMLLAAQRELNLDLAMSVLVGDKPSDIEAAHRAGVGHAVLMRSAHPAGGDKTKLNTADVHEVVCALDRLHFAAGNPARRE